MTYGWKVKGHVAGYNDIITCLRLFRVKQGGITPNYENTIFSLVPGFNCQPAY